MKIDFEYNTPNGKFRDALYLPDDNTYTESQIEAMKKERLDNWLLFLENSLSSEPQTIEVDGIVYEKVEIDGQTLLKPLGA